VDTDEESWQEDLLIGVFAKSISARHVFGKKVMVFWVIRG
jgi:hypothetical protein